MSLNSSPVIDLPFDLLIEILSKLSLPEVAQFCQTNLRLNMICQNKRLWTSKLLNDFPLLNINEWTSKFLNDFPLLNINKHTGDLFSYIEVYKSLLKPLSLIKRLTYTNGNCTHMVPYTKHLGTIYLSFFAQEDGITDFQDQLQSYLTPTSIIVIINSNHDPLFMGMINGDSIDMYQLKNSNNLITEVIILDIEDVTKDLKRYLNDQSIPPNSSLNFNPFGFITRTIKANIPPLSQRYNLEQAQARVDQIIEKISQKS